ncbi:hypothetical protein [Kordia jejudonensis]|uniref:hypothetical protein n=1 Tax=Kordia jejudonensis TaxID=1348245 RepID=UPI00062902BE|nr:hypothetical protein [Kordia jejudonensis]
MKKQFVWMYLLFATCLIYGQDSPEYDTPSVIPQSPEVASLLRYSEVPVSYYSGIPNVGVPIYNLQGRELSAPINLSYHAGGIRVSEEAGWVGLGWNLSAGGQITRTVRGRRDDQKPWGFIHTPYTVDIVKRTCNPHPNDPPLPYNNSCSFYTNDDNGAAFDLEPDDFNYSMLGQSGRFMFSQDRDTISTGEIIQFPNKNVIIEPIFQVYDPNDPNNPNNQDSGNIVAWKITDTNGNVFRFEEGNIFYQSQAFQQTNGAFEIPNSGNNSESYTETWDLVSVTSPNGDVITFEYDRPILPNHIVSDPYNDISTASGSESFILKTGTGTPANDHIKTYSVVYRSYTLLSKIISSKGSVEFIRAALDREDTQSSKQRLEYIKILNTDGNEIQRVSLEHSYFISTPSDEPEFISGATLNGSIEANVSSFINKRLKLDKVVFKGMHGGYNAADDYSYRFDYNTAVMLPHKRSQAQDHWGYYNGADDNNSLIPYVDFISNRDANPAYSSACILNKITYPEGGVTKLYYENNRGDINNMAATPYEEVVAKVEAKPSYPYTVVANGSGNTYTFTNTFSISNTAKSSTTDINKTQVSYAGFSNRCDNEDSFYGTPGDQVCDFMTFKITNTTDGSVAHSGSIWDNGFVDLLKGQTYEVEIKIIDSYDQYNMAQHYSSVNLKWLDEDQNPPDDYYFDYFGGLRVQGIKTYDKNKLTAYRSFEYTYGYVLSQPEYFSISIGGVQKIVSQSWVPLLTTQSGYVGYGQVKERIHPVAIETGYSNLGSSTPESREIFRKYSFFSDEDGEFFDIAFPGAPFTSEYWAGNLLLEKVEDKSTTHHQYVVVDINNNNYSVEKVQGISHNRDMRIAYHNSLAEYVTSNDNLEAMQDCATSNICSLDSHLYTLWSGQWLPNKQIVISKEGTRELTQVTESFYESIPQHHNPTKTVMIDSKGDEYETTYSYAYEENHTGLLTENRLGIPLVTKQYKGTELMQTTKMNYSVFAGTANNLSNLLPASIDGAKKSNILEERVTYHDYTPFGQPREVSKTDGTHITYLWGYNYNYPIAKIENATFQEVSAIIDESSIQNLTDAALESALSNLRTSLPNAMISTFIYEPMIGVIQTTDPRDRNTYYNYDSMGRLKYVLDHDQHVLSENNYHYKNN